MQLGRGRCPVAPLALRLLASYPAESIQDTAPGSWRMAKIRNWRDSRCLYFGNSPPTSSMARLRSVKPRPGLSANSPSKRRERELSCRLGGESLALGRRRQDCDPDPRTLVRARGHCELVPMHGLRFDGAQSADFFSDALCFLDRDFQPN
jgi:hypothetical protein